MTFIKAIQPKRDKSLPHPAIFSLRFTDGLTPAPESTDSGPAAGSKKDRSHFAGGGSSEGRRENKNECPEEGNDSVLVYYLPPKIGVPNLDACSRS